MPLVEQSVCRPFIKNHNFGKVCHLCDTPFNGPYFHHFTLTHTHLSNPEWIISSLSCSDSDIFSNLKYNHYFFLQCHCWLVLHNTLTLTLMKLTLTLTLTLTWTFAKGASPARVWHTVRCYPMPRGSKVARNNHSRVWEPECRKPYKLHQ